jgi:hypothetical protein
MILVRVAARVTLPDRVGSGRRMELDALPPGLLKRLRKNSLDEGHGFSRAVNVLRGGRLQPLRYGFSL